MSKEVKIELTEAQKAKIKAATGKSMNEVKVTNVGSNVAVSMSEKSARVSEQGLLGDPISEQGLRPPFGPEGGWGERGGIDADVSAIAAKSLRGAQVEEAGLRGAEIEEAGLRGAEIEEAGLRGAEIEEAGLRGAEIEEAGLRGAEIEEAGLRGAEIEESGLRGAEIGEAGLRGGGGPEAG
jgi:hypothetical protein